MPSVIFFFLIISYFVLYFFRSFFIFGLTTNSFFTRLIIYAVYYRKNCIHSPLKISFHLQAFMVSFLFYCCFFFIILIYVSFFFTFILLRVKKTYTETIQKRNVIKTSLSICLFNVLHFYLLTDYCGQLLLCDDDYSKLFFFFYLLNFLLDYFYWTSCLYIIVQKIKLKFYYSNSFLFSASFSYIIKYL